MKENDREQEQWLQEVYAKLEEAEEDVREGSVRDGRAHLKELRAKYGL